MKNCTLLATNKI